MQITMKSRADIDAARARLAARDLDFTEPDRLRFWRSLYRIRYRAPMQPVDPMKSWDVANAVEIVDRQAPDRGAPVLDMGCFNSEILYALHALGYRRLHGCDLNPMCRWMPYWNSIKYGMYDLMNVPFPDHTFGAITCVSVVEHGVSTARLAREVARLLRPGGVFVVSTDYDATGRGHAIDPDFRVFGQPWRIFDPAGLAGMLAEFEAEGLTPIDPSSMDGRHEERPIHWNDQDYTFTMIGLRARG